MVTMRSFECIKSFRYMQYLSAVSVGILQFSSSLTFMWVSPMLPKLTTPNSNVGVTLTYEEVSWMLSTTGIGEAVGSLLIGVLLDRVGPKRTLLLSSTLLTISSVIFGFANSLTMLVLGRFIAGMGRGITIYCFPIYICEIASKDIRGKLGTIPVFIGVLGNLFSLAAGPYLGYIEFIIICSVFPVIFFFAFLFIPDSPYHLLKAGKRKEAQLSLARFSSLSTSVEEIETKLQEIEETIRQDTGDLTLKQSLCAPNFRKSLVIVSAAKIIVTFCGVTFITTYIQVIAESSNTGLSTKMVSVIYGVIQIPSVLLSGFLVDRFGRKPLYCISSLGAGIALILEGTYLYLQGLYNLQSIAFMPILFLIAYQLSVSFGLTYLPTLLVGELFTTRTKKIGGPLAMSLSSLVAFGSVKICGSLFESWGMYTLFWIFGGFCVLGILFALYVLPETKGKSFDEIQKSLLSTKNVVNSKGLELIPLKE
ncbi:hypothetical protein RI129_009636 [Pyrocoelia pectoralis]|uniref:Major facilitator superfamily (MFS) profile domain-containing protein n=1 Tax=Pyrocoelia pectoralis TaxID=417401 RepID=A0AAN7VCW4_9COLE